MIGAGIFSLPIGLWHATPLPGLVIMACMCVLSAGTYWMIGYCCLVLGVSTFRELWNKVLSPGSAWVIDVTIFVNGYLTLLCYVILIGDFTTKAFAGLLGDEHLLATSRPVNQWTITLLVLLPLSLAQDLRKLAFTSVLGLSVLVYVVALVIYDSWQNSPAELSPDTVLAQWRMGGFEAIALYTHAFVAHYNAPKLFSEFSNPTQTRWATFVVCAYTIAFIVYSSFAWAGFRRFEGLVEGNVLRNYGPRVDMLIAWLGMGFSISFTYPLVFNSTREAIVNLVLTLRQALKSSRWVRKFVQSPRIQEIRRFSQRNNFRRTHSLAGLLGPGPEDSGKRLVGKPGNMTSFAIVMLTTLMGSYCEDVGIVNALAGSLMGVMICLVLPAVLFFNTLRVQLQSKSQVPGVDPTPLLARPAAASVRSTHQWLLRLGQAVAILTGVVGITVSIIGTVLILRRA